MMDEEEDDYHNMLDENNVNMMDKSYSTTRWARTRRGWTRLTTEWSKTTTCSRTRMTTERRRSETGAMCRPWEFTSVEGMFSPL
jgi:hypothetical protein